MLDYEGYLELVNSLKAQKNEDSDFLFTDDTKLNYEVKETEKEELERLVSKYFSTSEKTEKFSRSKCFLKEINRQNAYFKVKGLKLSGNNDLSYLKNLEKEALLEHILILELAFDYAMNALEEKNKGNYYEF